MTELIRLRRLSHAARMKVEEFRSERLHRETKERLQEIAERSMSRIHETLNK